MKLEINKSFEVEVPITEETKKIIKAYGLTYKKKIDIIKNLKVDIQEPFILYIFGYSGSGKSIILNEIRDYLKQNNKQFVYIYDWKQQNIPNKPLIEFFADYLDYQQRINLLSKFGLGESWKFVSYYNNLSDGEKFRFVLYYNFIKLLKNKGKYFIIDEFCATLDRLTAKAISKNIHKLHKQYNISFILASTHQDIIPYLNPTHIIYKEFSSEVKLENVAN